MKTVYLVSGPRGAGKTTALREFRRSCPRVRVINRDSITLHIYSNVYGDGYGSYWNVHKLMKRLLCRAFAQGYQHTLLDAYTCGRIDRLTLAQLAREAGAERVVLIFFTTPLEQVCEWFWQKPEVIRRSALQHEHQSPSYGTIAVDDDAPDRAYERHMSEQRRVLTEDFLDEVIFFDPTTQRLKDLVTFT